MEKIFIINFFRNIKELDKQDNIGGTKFDRDLTTIFTEMGFILKIFPMTSKKRKIKSFFKIIYELLSNKKSIYFFRYPLVYLGGRMDFIDILYEKVIYKIMNLSRHKIAIIISDLDFIRYGGFNEKIIKKEICFLKNFDYIIAHNNIMMNLLIENGVNKEKIINQEIGNNIKKENFIVRRSLSKTIIFSGNLSKSKFLNKLFQEKNLSYKVNLYGIGFSIKKKTSFLEYKGSYSSEDIVKVMEGSWGLVWDGDDIYTCSGNLGEYTKINNPSKFSQYIVAGLPVIVWKKAAIAEVVEKYKLGFTINSLIEINNILDTITEIEYQGYINNVMNLREKVKEGYHFKKAIKEILNRDIKN